MAPKSGDHDNILNNQNESKLSQLSKLPSRFKGYLNSPKEKIIQPLKYRLWAFIFLLMHLAAVPFWGALSLALFIKGRLVQKLIQSPPPVKQIPTENRRRVLVTGSPMTKALHIIRILGRAGHEIVLADSETYKMNCAQHSKFVTKFRTVSSKDYVRSMVSVAKEEAVDWFVPVSHTKTSIWNTVVAEKLRRETKVKCLIFNEVETTEMLDDKVNFLDECKFMGLSVPMFHRVNSGEEVWALRNRGVFENNHFFLKPLVPYSDERENFTRIPHDSRGLQAYLADFEDKIRLDNPYFVCQFIRGKEFASNAICCRGEITAIQVVPSSPTQIDYDAVDHKAIEEWTETFVRERGLNGMVCFDFLEDKITGKVYCIECNPRLHSAITAYNYDPRVEVAVRGALEPESLTSKESRSLPVRPLPNQPHFYWLYNELAKVFRRELSLGEFTSIVKGGKEALFDEDDPIPFFWNNTAQIIHLLWQRIWTGDAWSIVNPCMGQLR